MPLVAKLVNSSPRYHRAEVRRGREAAAWARPLVEHSNCTSPCFQSTEYSIMVIGVPNVGKSSLINSLRRKKNKKGTPKFLWHWEVVAPGITHHAHSLLFPKGKATAVGGEPGVTKAVLTRIQVLSPPCGCWLQGAGFLP